MRRTLWSLFALVLLSSPAFAGAPDYFTEAGKDFGPTPRGPVLVHYFTITNTTNQVVNIGTARVSCGCVSATVMKNQLQPGESTVVHAAMDTRRIPTAYVTKTVIVYVPFFSPTMEEVQLKVTSVARDDMVLSPDTIAFGTVKKGKATTATTKLTIYGQPNLNVTGVDSSGGFINAVAKQVSKGANDVTYEVTATLDEKCPVGNWTAELSVKTTTPGLEKIRIPVSVMVTTPVAMSPESITVTDMTVGNSTEHRVMLQGDKAFKILQVKGVDDVVVVKVNTEEARPVHILTIAVKSKTVGDISRLLEIETDHAEAKIIKLPILSSQPVKK
ncbi:hypothetical protein BH11PLA2_BH11PLA2_07160 [soil metagenome]